MMRCALRYVSVRSVAALLLLAFARGMGAQAPSGILPPAADLVARYVKVTRMDSVLLNRNSLRIRYRLEVPATGVTGTLELIRARPNLVMQTTALAGRGESKRGFDGQNGWELNPSRGPRIFADSELAEMRDDAAFNTSPHDTLRYRKRETVELTELGGEKCYRVRVLTASGRESFECFSVETGLLVAMQRKVTSLLGESDELSLFGEYREFGGALFASRRTVQAFGQKVITTLIAVELDTVTPEEFELPPAVRALIRTPESPSGE